MKDRLKELRKSLGLKQRELAARLGTSTSTLGGWESGHFPIPSTRVYQLCKEFNVRREWLERGEGEIFEPKTTREDAFVNVVERLISSLPATERELCLETARKAVEMQREEFDGQANETLCRTQDASNDQDGLKDRLKELRKSLGLKQRELAARLGVETGLVGHWESGRGVPSTRVYQLCKEFNVRREWLERGEGEIFEPKTTKPTEEEMFQAVVNDLLSVLPDSEREFCIQTALKLVERYKAKAKPEEPRKNASATEPILVAENRKGDEFTA